ncbi:MAG TPA: hypothetical protein DCY13_12635 [Verrucomicrobiales bacterium]|nr:hypothetical protein [Verrucomicrobiales bacterium]
MERQEEGNGRQLPIRKKRILELDHMERGLCIPALDVKFPMQQGKRADADEPDGFLEECTTNLIMRLLRMEKG